MKRELKVTDSAKKELRKVPAKDRGRVAAAIDTLTENPVPDGCRKMEGVPAFRIRVGDYCVIYSFGKTSVTISKIAHRSTAYR